MDIYIRRRRISQIKEDNWESCGYFDKLHLWESFEKCEEKLKNEIGTHEISGVSNKKLRFFVKGNDSPFIFYDIDDKIKDPVCLPTHYKINFLDTLDKFLVELNVELKKNFIKLFYETKNINIFKPHSTKIDKFAEVFIESYRNAMNKYQDIGKSEKIMDWSFFSDAMSVMDLMIRYIKSFIFSMEYKKYIVDSKDDKSSIENIVEVMINALFKEIKGREWFITENCNIPKPIPIEKTRVYDYPNLVMITPQKKDCLFKEVEDFDIKKMSLTTPSVMEILKTKNIWPHLEKMLEIIKPNAYIIAITIPNFEKVVTVKKIIEEPGKLTIDNSENDSDIKKITYMFNLKPENTVLLLNGRFNSLDDGVTLNELKYDSIKHFSNGTLHVFYKFK